MKLRKRFVIGLFALLVVGFLGMEWSQTRHAGAVVAGCLEVAQLENRSPHFELLCGQQQTQMAAAARERMLGGALLTLIVTGLVALWLERAVAKPLQSIRHHVRLMGLGSWGMGTWQCNPSPDRQEIKGYYDEVFDLATAMRDLGERLDLSVCQIEAASRRSTMALLTRRTERRLELIREYIGSARQIIESARAHQQLAPRHLLDNLGFVEREIANLERSLESDFLAELSHRPVPHCAKPRTDTMEPLITSPASLQASSTQSHALDAAKVH